MQNHKPLLVCHLSVYVSRVHYDKKIIKFDEGMCFTRMSILYKDIDILIQQATGDNVFHCKVEDKTIQ
jgi:hypothetical protein